MAPVTANNIIRLDDYRRPRVEVERAVAANRPWRTCYRLTGQRSEDVQDYINSLVFEVEQSCRGYGRFLGPHLVGTKYVALGEIVTLSDRIK